MYNVVVLVTGLGQCSLDYLAVVDAYPSVDTKKEVNEWHEQGGGPVATALVALSRLGISCRFYGIIGSDDAGEKIRQSLINEGIDVGGIIERQGTTSQVAFITIERRTARRTIFWRRPSGEPFRQEELGEDFLKGSDFLLLDGLMESISFYAAERARALKIPVMLDAGRVRPSMLEIARISDYVVASQELARDLRWDLSHNTLQREREKLRCRALTITSGAQGSITASKNKVFHVPAFKVEAVDTTGAGDVFHGGYIYGLLQGWDLKDTVTFASALAAMKCTKIGGRSGIPRLSEVMEFLAGKGHRIPQRRWL